VTSLPTGTWFEDFLPGQRFRHARGATVGEFECAVLAKQVMNTAEVHWNHEAARAADLGQTPLVFGLITASLVFGLVGPDTAENAVREIGCSGLRFVAPVNVGATVYAYTEVVSTSDSQERPDAGVVQFRHWGVADGLVVFEAQRSVLVKRRSTGGDR
jgi:acyl dehydratase